MFFAPLATERKSVLKHFLRCGWIIIFAWLLLGAGKYQPQREYLIDMPAQRVDVALNAIADEFGLSVLFLSNQVQSVSTPAINGSYTVQNALKVLLKDSGLSADLSFDGVITISAIKGEHKNERKSTVIKRKRFWATMIASLIGSFSSQVSAQAADLASKDKTSVLEEVLVTAQRREENLNDVPIAVVAISERLLESSGVNATQSIPELVPSVQLVRSGPSGMFFVRGVGNTSGGTGEEGANSFYVDGVFLPDLKQSILKFNNIERIEVLKGPQGTLFGRNSSGGLVNVITKQPGQEFETKVKVGVASYQTYTGQAYVAGPISDSVSADIALTYTDQNDGWGENQITGEDVGRERDWGARTKWIFEPNERLKLTSAAEYTKLRSDQTTAFRLAQGATDITGTPAPSDPYDTNTPNPQYNKQDNTGLSLTAEYDLGAATLTSITAARVNNTESALDADTGPTPLAIIYIESKTDSLQQELRLSSNDTDPFGWQTGVFLLRSESDLSPQSTTGAAFGGVGAGFDVHSNLRTWSSSIFGELSYSVTAQTHLTAGLRYTQDKLKLEAYQRGVGGAPLDADFPDDSTTEGEMTYRLAARQDLSENVNVYASYNRGFKSGTYSMSAPSQPPVKPQVIDAFEIGVKSELWERRLRLNAAAFHYEIDDYQIRAATGPGAPAQLLNAAQVEVDGVEIEFEVMPIDRLRLFGAATFLNSEFVDFPFAPYTYPNPVTAPLPPGCTAPNPAPGGASECISSAKGNTTPLAPEFAGNIGISYTIPLGEASELDLSLLYSYNDGYYFEVDNRLEQPAYSTVNGSVTYRHNANWGVELWGRNLNDETYYVQKLGNSLADIAVPAAPRTYGLSVYYHY